MSDLRMTWRYVKQEWNGEMKSLIRSWWTRHYAPARAKQLEHERNYWKRWLEQSEQRLFVCLSNTQAITDSYQHWQLSIDVGDQKAEAKAHDSFFDLLDGLTKDSGKDQPQGFENPAQAFGEDTT